MGSKKKWLFNTALLIVITAMTLFALLHGEDLRQIRLLLDLANGWYWLASVALIIPFVACESLILYILLRNVGSQPKPLHCLIYSFIGFFFSCITPAAGGGQPAQVVYMRKDGLNPGITTPILMVVTICYKLVLVLAGLALFILRPHSLVRIPDLAIIWACIGWTVNVTVVFVMFLLIVSPGHVESLCLFLLNLIARFHISQKRLDRLKERLETAISKYREVTSYIQNNGKLILIVIFISVIQRCILFSVTWLVLRSFHFSLPWLEVVLMQSMVALGTDMIPLPGGSGANERMFLLIFEQILGETMVLPVLMTSRAISYYGQLVICGFVFFIFSQILGKKSEIISKKTNT